MSVSMRVIAVQATAAGALSVCMALASPALAESKPCIGNSGPLTGPIAYSGIAIKMGAELAIDEINARGGVLGKKLSLIQYDDAGSPPRGVDNTRRLALQDDCIVILGGAHSTVALAQVVPIHEIKIPYVGVIAASTNIVENGRDPNFMFRVSAKDRWVAKYLVAEALKRAPQRKVGILFENTGWGKGAVPDIQAALKESGLKEVGAEPFNWEDTDMTAQLIRLRDAGAEVVIL